MVCQIQWSFAQMRILYQIQDTLLSKGLIPRKLHAIQFILGKDKIQLDALAGLWCHELLAGKTNYLYKTLTTINKFIEPSPLNG